VSKPVQLQSAAKILLLAFALILALPVLLSPWADDEARATWEKRELASPARLMSRFGRPDFFTELQAVVDDHLYGALALNRAYRRLQYYGFSDAPVPNVALGEGELVFLTSHTADRPYETLQKLCNMPEQQVVTLHRALLKLHDQLVARNVKLTLAVMPSKLALYVDRLPPSVPSELRARCAAAVPAGTMPLRLESLSGPYELFYPLQALHELRDSPQFYPPENFHANSRANHEFARRFLELRGFPVKPAFDAGARLESIPGDLLLMGFKREIKTWRYDYDAYGVQPQRRAPDWLRPVYPGARGFSRYHSSQPLDTGRALILSDSFGAYLAPHLAPAYAALTSINIKDLKSSEREAFLDTALRETEAGELIILVHDAGLPNPALRRFLGY
jgi:hypothetical protein